MASKPRSFLSNVFLTWVSPVVRKGFWSPLCAEDVPELPAGLADVRGIYRQAQTLWDAEINMGTHERVSLWRVYRKMLLKEAVVGCVVGCIQGLLNTVARPLLLKLLLSEFADGDVETVGTARPVLLVVGIGLMLLAEGICGVDSKHLLSDRLGTMFVTITSTLIQAKASRLRCRPDSMQESGLMGNDVVRTFENLKFSTLGPMAVSGLLGGVVVLLLSLGWIALIGLAVMTAILLLNLRFARLAKNAEARDLAAADYRLMLTKQLIHGAKAVKFASWEVPCQHREHADGERRGPVPI